MAAKNKSITEMLINIFIQPQKSKSCRVSSDGLTAGAEWLYRGENNLIHFMSN